MKKVYFLLIAFFALLFRSFSHENKIRDRSRIPLAKIALRDSVRVDYPYQTEGLGIVTQPVRYRDNDWLLLFGHRSGEAKLIGIDSVHKGTHVTLDGFKKIVKGRRVAPVFYKADSIWIYFYDSSIMKLVTLDGAVKLTMPVDRRFKGRELFLYGGYYHNPLYYVPDQHRIYFCAADGPFTGPAKYFSNPHFASVVSDGKEWRVDQFFGSFPPVYSREWFYGTSSSQFDAALFQGKIFASYYLSDSIYAYHPDGHLQGAYDAASRFVSRDDFELFDPARAANRDYIMEFGSRHSSYSYLATNASSEQMLRVCDHKFNYYNEDSTINRSIEARWSAVVVDKDLQLSGEIVFDADKFLSTSLMPYRKGFWIKAMHSPMFYYYEIL